MYQEETSDEKETKGSESRRSSVEDPTVGQSGSKLSSDLYAAHDFDINIDVAIPEPAQGKRKVTLGLR